MIVIDSDVLIDLLRRYPPAVQWIQENRKAIIMIPGFVAMEMIDGCSNRIEVQRIKKFLHNFQIFWPTDVDCERAFETFSKFRLSHGLGIIDAFIGEMSLGLGIPLFTFNERHFGVIKGLKIKQYYQRLPG